MLIAEIRISKMSDVIEFENSSYKDATHEIYFFRSYKAYFKPLLF